MAFTRPKASQIDFDITNITDPLIRLNSGESGSADKDVGIVIERGSDTNAAIIYDESANQFAVSIQMKLVLLQVMLLFLVTLMLKQMHLLVH